jgi:hypothetical protein
MNFYLQKHLASNLRNFKSSNLTKMCSSKPFTLYKFDKVEWKSYNFMNIQWFYVLKYSDSNSSRLDDSQCMSFFTSY